MLSSTGHMTAMALKGAEIGIEVAYIGEGRQVLRTLRVRTGTSVAEAIALSGVEVSRSGADCDRRVGIFGRIVSLDTLLNDGDRVEIYRPLVVDPKTRRRHRADRKG